MLLPGVFRVTHRVRRSEVSKSVLRGRTNAMASHNNLSACIARPADNIDDRGTDQRTIRKNGSTFPRSVVPALSESFIMDR
jgi:hypothetical protein